MFVDGDKKSVNQRIKRDRVRSVMKTFLVELHDTYRDADGYTQCNRKKLLEHLIDTDLLGFSWMKRLKEYWRGILIVLESSFSLGFVQLNSDRV